MSNDDVGTSYRNKCETDRKKCSDEEVIYNYFLSGTCFNKS